MTDLIFGTRSPARRSSLTNSVPEDRVTSGAELQSGTLSDIGLILFNNSPMISFHDARHIAHANPDEFLLCRQIAGSALVMQGDREAALDPGDTTLVDPRRLCTTKFFMGSRMLVLKIPRGGLEARIGAAQGVTAYRLRPMDAETSLMSAFLGCRAMRDD